MISFNIASILGGEKYDLVLLKNILATYFDALAKEFNSAVSGFSTAFKVELFIDSSMSIGASSAPHYVYDPKTNSSFNSGEESIKTGYSVNGDIKFYLNMTSGFVENLLSKPDPVVDVGTGVVRHELGVFLHEFAHAVCFNSHIDEYTGAMSSAKTSFDKNVLMLGDVPYYSGKYGVAVYGENVELYRLGSPGTSIVHFAYKPGIRDQINTDLLQSATRWTENKYTDLDLAVFKDAGYSVTKTLASYNGKDFVLGEFGVKLTGTSAINTVYMPGKRSDFYIDLQGDDITLVSKLTGGVQLFSDIERLSFDDVSMAFDIEGKGGQAYRLYQAAFDRKPDLPGLGYWVKELSNGMLLSSVSASFLLSNEFKAKYGDSPSDQAFLTALYENVLHRSPDQVGFDWWMNQMQSGFARESVLASFSESVENKAQVIGSIGDGFEYIPY